jgi:ABC-2 type transport system permease protein
MEFPRYRTFAQSFPNTVPYSEGIGFIGRVKKPHGHRLHLLRHRARTRPPVVGSPADRWRRARLEHDVGKLAEYSALQVMAHKYGRDLMHRYLRHELDRYLRGRAGEIRHEPPLALVQREDYVWYQKGGQICTRWPTTSAKTSSIALHNFLMQYRYANANNQVDASRQLGPRRRPRRIPILACWWTRIRAQTPPELQYLVDDGFNRIVLYDNRTISATSQKTPDGKYKVTLEVQASKVQADGNGVETPMPLNDYIEVGVFSGLPRTRKSRSI